MAGIVRNKGCAAANARLPCPEPYTRQCTQSGSKAQQTHLAQFWDGLKTSRASRAARRQAAVTQLAQPNTCNTASWRRAATNPHVGAHATTPEHLQQAHSTHDHVTSLRQIQLDTSQRTAVRQAALSNMQDGLRPAQQMRPLLGSSSPSSLCRQMGQSLCPAFQQAAAQPAQSERWPQGTATTVGS